MIQIGTYRDLNDEDYDEVWFIMRSLKREPHLEHTIVRHVPELSPSSDLFHQYLKLKERGLWNEETFEEMYIPQFLWEMHSSSAIKKLHELYELGQRKCILLVCACQNEALCHRSIILGLLQGKNQIEVQTDITKYMRLCGEDFMADDYSFYYNKYQKMGNHFLSNMQKSKWNTQTTFYLLVAGSRTYDNYGEMCNILDYTLSEKVKNGYRIVIVSGGAKGADNLAEQYAANHGYESKVMPADWDRYGKSAGYRRNESMHNFISCPSEKERGCICFWDGESKGTAHNFKLAKEHDTQIKVYDFKIKRFLSPSEINAVI